MGIKNFIVAALICSLISVSSAQYNGIASYNTNFPGKYLIYPNSFIFRNENIFFLADWFHACQVFRWDYNFLFCLIGLLRLDSYKCPLITKDKFGKFYGAINPFIGSACERRLMIKCNNKPYCKSDKFLEVQIVDNCIPQFCPGKYDVVLSKAAFDELATTDQPTIEIQWQ